MNSVIPLTQSLNCMHKILSSLPWLQTQKRTVQVKQLEVRPSQLPYDPNYPP